MLNTKYIITQQQQLQQNPSALGNAWFVETIKKVNTPNQEIAALSNFNPANEAIILDSEFDNYIGSYDPQKQGRITLADYKPHHLTYTSNSNSEQLAVFSEIWYGPKKGWKVYIDGQLTDHIRSNYCLRALKVPAGNHKIEFRFQPDKYFIGKKISLASSIGLILVFLGFIGYQLYRVFTNQIEWKSEPSAIKAKPQKATKRKVLKKTRRKKR